ncbi:MAG: transposase, partial [Acetobacteraceae bacterium]
QLMARQLNDVRLAVLMIDGIDLKGRTNVVALGITTDGVKIPLGLWEGSTENATVATALLADLVDRGLDVEQGVLAVLDGVKALRKAVNDVLGARTPVQRCVRHYPDARVIPTCGCGRCGGGRITPTGVGIIRGLRGRRAVCRAACSARGGCWVGSSARSLVL